MKKPLWARSLSRWLEKVNKTLEDANLELSRKDKIIETSSAVSQGYSLMNAGKLDEAEKQFQTLLKTYLEKSDYPAIARTYMSLGDISLQRARSKLFWTTWLLMSTITT